MLLYKKDLRVYGNYAIAEKTVQKWFTRFKRDFNIEDQERSGRSSMIDNDQIAELIKSNTHGKRHRGDTSHIYSTVVQHLETLSYVNCYLGTL